MEVENGAAPAAAEGNAAPAVSTPEISQVQVVEPAKKSIEDTMAEVFDKMNPPRDEQTQRFVAKDKPAETQETVEAKEPPETEIKDQPQTEPKVEPDKPVIEPPQSWSAEMKAKWASYSPEDQAYFAKRESEAHKRITELGEAAKAHEPFRQITERYQASFKGMGAVQAYEKLAAANEYIERDPVGGIKWLMNAYGIDPSHLTGQPGTDGNTEVAQLRQTVSQLQRQLSETSNRVQSREQREAQTQQESIQKQVEDFSKDKPHWAELESDIISQIHAIKATDPNLQPEKALQQAYDRALKLNEGVQAKIAAAKKADDEAKAKAEAAKKAAEAKKAATLNVGRGANATSQAKGKWEDTMRQTADRLMG